MRMRLGIVLLVALAIEALNFSFLTPALDVGDEPGTPWYIQAIELQWVLLHWLGMMTLDWFEQIAGCHQGGVVGGCGRVDSTVLFASGYFSTTLLLLLITPVLVHLFGRGEASEGN